MTRSRFVKISFIISILIQIGFESFGQIGNEWYNPSQSYFKFKIGQKGIYRLNYNTLSNHGIQIDDIDPKTIKIFKNGEEQYIFVSWQDDNRFDKNDFIELYATKNNGSLDVELYKDPAYIESHHNEAIEKQDIKNAWDYILKANSIKINA